MVEVWLSITLRPRAGYVGIDAFKATMATRLDAELGAGATLYRSEVFMASHGLGAQLVDVFMGLAPNPTSEADIEVMPTQILRFDAGRTSVLVVS